MQSPLFDGSLARDEPSLLLHSRTTSLSCVHPTSSVGQEAGQSAIQACSDAMHVRLASQIGCRLSAGLKY